MASFIVPLNWNKLDMKDYLWNAYGVPALSVRSYIQQRRVQQDSDGKVRPRIRYWHRPRSVKRMIVEMGDGEHGGPFVWPDNPEDLTAYVYI
jgi:large subunit ribosomal protein L23